MSSGDNKRSENSSPIDDSLITTGMRIQMWFKNGEWHDLGAIDKITRGEDGKIIKVISRSLLEEMPCTMSLVLQRRRKCLRLNRLMKYPWMLQ